MIKIYDTKAREKRPFVPVADGKVNMYVCGPTVYNYIHIGNARTFISFDTIRRYLIWRGYEVKFVQNITDVDDKIIKKANEEGRSASEVAAEYAQAFIDDMRAAGVMDPDVRPRATEEIGEMIALVEKLIEGGHAYEVEGDVYFAVRSYEGYGQLSGRNVVARSGETSVVSPCSAASEKRISKASNPCTETSAISISLTCAAAGASSERASTNLSSGKVSPSACTLTPSTSFKTQPVISRFFASR